MGSIVFLGVLLSMFIFGFLLYVGSFCYAYFFSNSGSNILFRDYYECGFNSINDGSNVVDIHFLVIGLVFLVYEMEVVLFIPMFLNLYNYSLLMIVFILLLLFVLGISFWYEWDNYTLDVMFT